MLKAMVFIDMENFDIAKYNYYKSISTESAVKAPKIDYTKMSQLLVRLSNDNAVLLKTVIFAPKPDDFLINDPIRKAKYDWVKKLNDRNYISVVEGRHVARPSAGFTQTTMNISERNSYYVVEKGTDVNLAATAISMAASNSFDIAIIVSGDTDYIPVMDILSHMGKLVSTVCVKNQSISRFKAHSDIQLVLDSSFFNQCSII